MAEKLTTKQTLFVAYYVKSFNATKAAKLAGYSKDTAGSIGHENLTKPEIKAEIDRVLSERLTRLGVSADRVLRELALLAFSDHADYVEVKNGTVRVKDTSDLRRNASRAIHEISETVTENGGSLKVKLYDKVKALELLGKHVGIFEDTVKHEGEIKVTITDYRTKK